MQSRVNLSRTATIFFGLATLLSAAEPAVPEAARQLLQDRKYSEAAQALDAAAKQKDAPVDYLLYLKARALHLDQKYDDAVLTYQALEKQHPRSPWVRKARFGRAVSWVRKGDFRAAELIYREEVAYLLSTTRKQEIADIYLEFAGGYFKPADENQAPDYQKALEFYGKALEVGPQPEKRIEVELLVAQCHQALGNHAKAAELFAQFVKDHAGHASEIEARYRLGECQMAQGQPVEARRTWQDLLAAHADAKSERIAEAAFHLAGTYPNEDISLGVAALEAFIAKYPEHKLASLAHLQIGQRYVARGRYEDAAASLKKFLAEERYATRDEVPEARNLLGRSHQLQKKFAEAVAMWREYLAKHPAHEAWSAVQRQIIDTEYLMGLEERQAKRYDAATKLWNEFLAKYPLDPRSPTILLQFGGMSYEQDQFAEAIADWRRVVSKYPGTNQASQAQFLLAATLEEKQSKFDEALKEYRKLTWGNFAAEAQRRIHRLTAKSMSIATERVFRSDETPKIKLVTRNVDVVTVRAYTVDLETYFRKMHLARGLEGLDIALIDPDQTIEFKVPKYVEHQQLESEIEIPLPSRAGAAAPTAGVMAVTVNSKTLEATTMIVQSDLDIVVKSSRDEVFVFAQNLRTGKPWRNARLLVSNGSQVFAEAITGDDGVFQHDYKELKDSGDVRVFAIADGSTASNVVNLQGVGVATGLTDKGFLYTDRPAYRAGQTVHVRGVVRRAMADAYVIDKGKKFTLEVYDARNRLLRQEQVALGEHGSFHSHFLLPETSPAGEYRLQIADEVGTSYQGTFAVHEYQLEPIRLSVDTERKVFYRGEEITGKIVARFYYGAPLANREIRYQLAGERMHVARTDDNGEVAFTFPTRDFREAQSLPLTVVLPERNLQTAVNFFLATQGYTIGVSTVRPVYVAGETFEVKVRTDDAEGKPIAEKLVLRVLEQTKVDGKLGERLVEKHDLATDSEGDGRVTLKLADGANYVLRVEGTDRFKNPISGEHTVQVSDDDDSVRLRILADRHTYKVGDRAVVRLHWREGPALALVTYQGARVLGHELVQLKTGTNDLPISMTSKLAPNFELSIAVMTDVREIVKADAAGKTRAVVRFHEANSPFSVQRDLRIKLEPKRKGDAKGDLRPGEEIEVAVTATDPQGKPISAEISLAMVEQSLLEMFSGNVASIHDFFEGGERASAVRTTSSVTFGYRPATRPINSRLLAEKDRVEIAAEESLRRREFAEDRKSGGGGFFDTDSAQVLTAGDALSRGDGEKLAELIDRVVDQNEWEGVGGPGTIAPFTANLSLQVQQTQEVQLQQDAMMLNMPAGASMAFGGNGGATAGRVNINAMKESGGVAFGVTNPRIILSEEQNLAGLTINSTDAPRSGKGMANNWENRWGYIAPSVTNLGRMLADNQKQSVVLFSDGTQQNVALGDLSGGGVALGLPALAKKLAAAGAVIMPDIGPQETGFWNPSIVTDDKGRATVTLTLPDRSTAWRFIAKGITADTLAGDAESDLTVKKDLFGELKLPLAFCDGDGVNLQASIHNNLLDKGQITATLKITIGEKVFEEKASVNVAKKGIHEVAFQRVLERQADAYGANVDAVFELTVAADGQQDVLRRVVPILPYGMPVAVTTSGSATSDTTTWVEAPKLMGLQAPSLSIVIGPSIDQSLLDVLLGAAPSGAALRGPWSGAGAASGLDVAVSDLMSAVALQKLLSATREAGNPQAQSLDGRIRSSLSLLVSAQSDDGGWSWTGRGGASNRFASAQAVWALSLAKGAGYTVPQAAFDKSLVYLKSQVAATAETDFESKATLLHALATVGEGDFALANRLHRNRPSLSSAALTHLALALVAMDRQPMAKEIIDVLAGRKLDHPADLVGKVGWASWSSSGVELQSLFALAVLEATPESPKAKELTDWLLAHRVGSRSAPEKATGPAMLALCQWFSRTRFTGERYKLAVFVNDTQVETLELDASAVTQTVAVPAKLLDAKGKQRVNFQLTGRGQFTYQCVLSGFVPADQLKSTTQGWQVRRFHEPAQLELDGQEVPRGFNLLQGNFTSFRNTMTQLPVGQRGRVELNVFRTGSTANGPDDQLEYLVITEPLPSGVTVNERSVTGAFERFEVSPGAITFYIGNRRGIGSISFEVFGYLPGQYRAGPTICRNAYNLEQMAVAGPKSLMVLPTGGKSGDEYRLTPQELFELAKRQFAKGELRLAGVHLSELLLKWNLQPEPYKESARMMLDIQLDGGPPAEIVRYFEIVKEKWPELELSFEKIVKVAAAYHELGEYERSYLVFRATVESSFLREGAVAGFLESQGEFARSVDVMTRLLAEYPPEPYVAAADYALAQRVYAKAPEAAADAKLREKKVNRVDLVRQALGMLESFLTAYPEDPAADQASFSVANALLELKAHKTTIAQCQRYAKRYPTSDFLDSYWYIIGYCHFAQGEHEQALAMCRQVAEHKRLEKRSGREIESPNRLQAIYILGQVYHSLGQAADAIREYTRVAEQFVDAKQAIDYFSRKDIGLAEVTTVKPGEAAEVELKFRNLPRCDAKVYRIDLMKFSLLKRNLEGITQINLAGIRPYHEAEIELGDGKDYRDRTKKLSLPLKEEGAYLVVARGEDLHASGLVLVSPLVVEIQEEASSGRVRATVKDSSKNAGKDGAAQGYVSDVHVKVIGTRNADFVSGETDLRGVFVADSIRGNSTVIAQASGDRYAFFRGDKELGPPPAAANAAAGRPAQQPSEKPAGNEADLLENIKSFNGILQRTQQQQLFDNNYRQDNPSGVKAKAAF